MSLIRNGFAVSCRRRGLLSALFSALLALALFDPGAATAQEAKQIKLTDKHIQGFMAASKDMGKLYAGANPDKPDPKLEARAAAIAKKNGFASLDEYDDASTNISMIFSGIDPQTKKFTEPPEQIRKEIASLKADKSVPDAEKKEDLAQLEASLKTAKPIQFKENIALVLKYFDQLAPDRAAETPPSRVSAGAVHSRRRARNCVKAPASRPRRPSSTITIVCRRMGRPQLSFVAERRKL
jgi:hypothetical protein